MGYESFDEILAEAQGRAAVIRARQEAEDRRWALSRAPLKEDQAATDPTELQRKREEQDSLRAEREKILSIGREVAQLLKLNKVRTDFQIRRGRLFGALSCVADGWLLRSTVQTEDWAEGRQHSISMYGSSDVPLGDAHYTKYTYSGQYLSKASGDITTFNRTFDTKDWRVTPGFQNDLYGQHKAPSIGKPYVCRDAVGYSQLSWEQGHAGPETIQEAMVDLLVRKQIA